ncbi:uncharacterized protein JCM6883_005953 [Sporobolomyces salmoneus]|uniref:uncharacterized protein n=1 Tax=Sporobolomyces salmoneus TaxID=183962 RepID=UPI00316EE1F4
MIPSRDLPPLLPINLSSIVEVLTSIRNRYLSPVTIDLRRPLELGHDGKTTGHGVGEGQSDSEAEKEVRDEFETKFLRNWLEMVVQLGLKQLSKGTEDLERWEAVIDEASGMISRLEDDNEDTDYILPSPSTSSSSSATLTSNLVRIHNHTLVSSTTGHRTWGSAPILARRLALSPERYFPLSSSSSPLRVLELGAGTGLVGLAALSTLSRLGLSNAVVTLSDGGESNVDEISTSGVLDNLRRNVKNHVNQLGTSAVHAQVETLSWDDYNPQLDLGGKQENDSRRIVPEEKRYDVILGADLVYESKQAESLWNAVAAHLRFPSKSSSTSTQSPPALHLVIPLRPTHVNESIAVDTVFPSPETRIGQDQARIVRNEDGERWRSIAREREEFSAADGFGSRGRGEKIIQYRSYRIEWEKVEGLS